MCEDRKLGKWYDAGGYTVGRGHGVCVSRHTLQHRGVWLEARSTGQRGAGIKCALCDVVQALMHPVQRRRRGNSRHQGALCHAGGRWVGMPAQCSCARRRPRRRSPGQGQVSCWGTRCMRIRTILPRRHARVYQLRWRRNVTWHTVFGLVASDISSPCSGTAAVIERTALARFAAASSNAVARASRRPWLKTLSSERESWRGGSAGREGDNQASKA